MEWGKKRKERNEHMIHPVPLIHFPSHWLFLSSVSKVCEELQCVPFVHLFFALIQLQWNGVEAWIELKQSTKGIRNTTNQSWVVHQLQPLCGSLFRAFVAFKGKWKEGTEWSARFKRNKEAREQNTNERDKRKWTARVSLALSF